MLFEIFKGRHDTLIVPFIVMEGSDACLCLFMLKAFLLTKGKTKVGRTRKQLAVMIDQKTANIILFTAGKRSDFKTI